MIIAIDGPAGSGKSTVAKIVATKLGFEYIDSGAIYRSITLLGVREFENLDNKAKDVAVILKEDEDLIKIVYENSFQKMYLGEEDVSEIIRKPEITKQVRHIANCDSCRNYVNQKMRDLAETYSIVIDGRDIGTVVFPEAHNKFYLDASCEIRAKRRAVDLNIEIGTESYENLLKEIQIRDEGDMKREIAPLIKADDAVVVDTSDLNIDQVVTKLLGFIKN